MVDRTVVVSVMVALLFYSLLAWTLWAVMQESRNARGLGGK